MSEKAVRREVLPVPRKLESVLYLIAGGWVGMLFTEGEWLSAVLIAVPWIVLIFAPRRATRQDSIGPSASESGVSAVPVNRT